LYASTSSALPGSSSAVAFVVAILLPRHHVEAFADPALHSSAEDSDVAKAGLPQQLRRTDGAFLCPSDGNEEASPPSGDLLHAVRKLVDGDVHGPFDATEGTVELRRRSHVQYDGRIGG
jgi:hypothetical protein